MAYRVNLILLALITVSLVFISGCSKPAVVDGVMTVKVGSQSFKMEIVADPKTREVGLGAHTSLPAGEGMLFSFPDSKLRKFVMRDCVFDIDIIFLDSAGRITAMHTMPIEDPKKPDESQYQYEMRLKKYSSKFNAQYAIELNGGVIETLDISEGEQIDLDVEYLQSITK